VGAPGFSDGEDSPRRPAGFNDRTHAPPWVDLAIKKNEFEITFLSGGKGLDLTGKNGDTLPTPAPVGVVVMCGFSMVKAGVS
jgi:hypothetical protein